jgi:hypothetical protein
MKYTVIFLLGLLTFAACKKEVTPQPEPPVTQQAPERDISLAYVYSMNSQVEVIVTDTAANFLLDTLLSSNDMHFLKVYSEQTKFNITTVDRMDSNNRTYVQTFYQVLPDHWNINQPYTAGFYDPDHTGEVNGTIYYDNTPAIAQGQQFQIGDASAGGYNGYNKMYSEAYKSKLPYHSCLLFPEQKLYCLYDATSTVDTVDISHLDSALTYTYEKTSPLNIIYRDVTIYEKKDDASSRVRFWHSTYPEPTPYYDIMYPSKGAQQYLVNFVAVDANDQPSFTTQFSDTIQTQVDFLDSSYYHITIHDSLHFDISFPKVLPSFYNVNLKGDNFAWDIHLPSTKNTFDGTGKMIDLSKSIRLKGMDYSKLHFGGLLLGNGDNMNYIDYYNFIFASDAAGKNRLHQWQWFPVVF